jgi:hypothetical protein
MDEIFFYRGKNILVTFYKLNWVVAFFKFFQNVQHTLLHIFIFLGMCNKAEDFFLIKKLALNGFFLMKPIIYFL